MSSENFFSTPNTIIYTCGTKYQKKSTSAQSRAVFIITKNQQNNNNKQNKNHSNKVNFLNHN